MSSTTAEKPRPVTRLEAIVPIASLIVLLGPNQIALGVATVHYAPFAFFNILSPLITIASAYAGIRMITTEKPAPRAR